MHFSTLVSSSLAFVGVASAHGTPGVPKIFGRRTVAELKARGILQNSKREDASHPTPVGKKSLKGRQVGGTDGQCGPGVGSCATGYCCSGAGWCGSGSDYCAAPDCQFNYGPGCDANTVPQGASTSSVARTKVGSVAYGGAGIYDCTVPNMIALTYDDGPYIYTSDILDILKSNDVPATFFITGNNLGKGEIDNAAYPWASLIQRMHNEGHQIASHTWSHQDLSNEVTHAQRLDQMYYNEMALRNILGFFPTYMRPPYSSCTSGSGCQADMDTLGYHIAYFDLDTEDYLNSSPAKIQTSKNDFSGNLSASNPATDNWLVIGHDIHEQTAHNLTQFMVTYAKQQGWTFGTVGQCLGDPAANWYRSSSDPPSSSSTVPTSTSTTTSSTSSDPTAVSTDGTCGSSSGYTCQDSIFGNCCSQYGWCGSTTDYCGTNCQPAFGTCGSGSSSTGSTTTSTTQTTTSTTSSTSATSTLKVSTDATCGGTSGNTCQGSSFGDCCSQYGWCGSTTNYCSIGCQPAFGTCS